MPAIDNSLRFGIIKPDGSLDRNPRICAITGQPIETGDLMVRVPDTNLFFRAKAPLNWPKNAEKFEKAKAELFEIGKSLVAKAPVPDSAPEEAVKPSKGGK